MRDERQRTSCGTGTALCGKFASEARAQHIVAILFVSNLLWSCSVSPGYRMARGVSESCDSVSLAGCVRLVRNWKLRGQSSEIVLVASWVHFSEALFRLNGWHLGPVLTSCSSVRRIRVPMPHLTAVLGEDLDCVKKNAPDCGIYATRASLSGIRGLDSWRPTLESFREPSAATTSTKLRCRVSLLGLVALAEASHSSSIEERRVK